MSQVHLMILGKVQGVCYRASCLEMAQKLGLNGWVKNLPTGQVEVVAQGKKEMIEKLIEWCKKGPVGARIDEIKSEWQDNTNTFIQFEIK